MVREDPYGHLVRATRDLHVEEALSWREGVLHVSWGAIVSGVVIILLIQFTLGLLGMAIGAMPLAITPAVTADISRIVGSWVLVTSTIAALCGAVVTSRLCNSPRLSSGVLHGLLAWALSVFMSALFLNQLFTLFAAGPLTLLVHSALVNAQANDILSQDSTWFIVKQSALWTFAALAGGAIAAGAGSTLGTPRQSYSEAVH